MPRLNIPIGYYMGIDPGQEGGIAVLRVQHGSFPLPFEIDGGWSVLSLLNKTEHEIALWLEQMLVLTRGGQLIKGAIESVHSMPKQGVASSFKFGLGYGFLRGLLVAHSIPFENPTPQRWQKDMGCLTRGDKKISRVAAQRRFPPYTSIINNQTADAMLIAAWRCLYGEKL